MIGDPAASYLKPLAKLPEDTNITVTKDRERLRELAPKADVLFNAEFFDPSLLFEVFPLAKKAQWVHAISAGVERILANPEIRASPIPLTNARGVFRLSLGEWIIGSMIFFAYEFRRLERSKLACKWEPFDHENLYEKTLGIVGHVFLESLKQLQQK